MGSSSSVGSRYLTITITITTEQDSDSRNYWGSCNGRQLTITIIITIEQESVSWNYWSSCNGQRWCWFPIAHAIAGKTEPWWSQLHDVVWWGLPNKYDVTRTSRFWTFGPAALRPLCVQHWGQETNGSLKTGEKEIEKISKWKAWQIFQNW